MLATPHFAADQDHVDGGRRSILGNFRSVFIGRLFSSLSMWLALMLLAKLSDPMTVGIYALAQALCIPIGEVAKMGLREIHSSSTSGPYLFGNYLALRLVAAGVALVLMVASGILQSNSAVVIWVVVLYALTRCMELVSDMVHGLFQAHERMNYIGRSLCLLGPLSLLFLSAGYWATGSLVVAVFGQFLAQLLVLAFYDVPMGRRCAKLRSLETVRPIWDRGALQGLALQALPLAFATVLVMIAVYLPRLVVESALGLSALGLFAALTALSMSPNRVVNSMGIAVSVRLAHYHAAGNRAGFVGLLGRFVLGVAAFGTLAVAIAAAFGDVILGLVYTTEFAAQGNLFVWLIGAATLRCIADVLKFGMVASRRFWWLAAQYAVVALVAVLTSFTLIPRLALTGAGIAMCLIFASHLIVVTLGLLYNLPRTRQSDAVV
ncbi:lipopolysaccharide biosynthesis protein [Mesorhizobium sp. IMUNJ 23033]